MGGFRVINHNCPSRPFGIEISKDGEEGLWYTFYPLRDSYQRLDIKYCPFCGTELATTS